MKLWELGIHLVHNNNKITFMEPICLADFSSWPSFEVFIFNKKFCSLYPIGNDIQFSYFFQKDQQIFLRSYMIFDIVYMADCRAKIKYHIEQNEDIFLNVDKCFLKM
jgi:hypothetical protein